MNWYLSMNSVEIIKKFYSALNSNNVQAVTQLLHPEILRIEKFDTTKTISGIKDFEAHVIEGRQTWINGGCTPEKFDHFGEKIIVHVHVRVQLKKNREWIEGKVFDGFLIQNNKIIEMNSYLSQDEAMKWAKK